MDLINELDLAIRLSACETPVWYLNHRKRWALFRDILLGVSRIRGGQRPRDFPMDPDGQGLLELAVLLQNGEISYAPKDTCSWFDAEGNVKSQVCPPALTQNGLRAEERPFYFGDWFVVFAALLEKAFRFGKLAK